MSKWVQAANGCAALWLLTAGPAWTAQVASTGASTSDSPGVKQGESAAPAADAGSPATASAGLDGGACAGPDGAQPPPSLAPLVAERRSKCARLKPYRPSFLEKQLLLVEKAERPPFGQWNLLGFYPRVQTIDHRSQVAVGARFWQPNVFRSAIDLHGAYYYSKAGFQYGEGQAGILPHRGDMLPPFAFKGDDVFELVNVRQDDNQPYMVYGQWYYRWSPRYDFYGTGPDSSKDDHADFRQKDKLLEAVAGIRLVGKLSLVGRAGRWLVSTGEGEDDTLPNVEDVFSAQEIPGYGQKLEYNRYGASLVFDGRDVRGNPHKGGVVAAQVLQFDQQSGPGPSFRRASADARLYVPLGHQQRVLALRTYFTRDDAAGDARVPFFALPAIGSGSTLRGFQSQRLRGERILLLQAEYRMELAPAVELAIFYDTAAVAARVEDKVGNWRGDGGFGLRFKTHDDVLARADVAWGNEGFRALFRFGSSF